MNGLRNWWAAEPWRIFGRKRWHYLSIYRSYRRGSWNAKTGRWLAGGEPRGWFESLWRTACFPHVHEEDVHEFLPDWTVPPGDTLLELMAERDMSDVDLSRKMLTDLPHVHGLIGGWEPLTESDALDLEEIFGVSFDFWMNYERRYREDLARLHPGMTVDLRPRDDRFGIGTLAEENFIDVTVCEFCGGPLDAEHPWRRGMDGAAAHEACLAGEDVA